MQAGALAGPGTLERFLDDALWHAGHTTLPFVAAAHDAPERLVELDLAHDAALRNPVAQPREPQPGARPSRRVHPELRRPRTAWPARGRGGVAAAPRAGPRGVARGARRRPRRDACACTCTASRAGSSRRPSGSGWSARARARDCRRGPRRRSTRCSRTARISRCWPRRRPRRCTICSPAATSCCTRASSHPDRRESRCRTTTRTATTTNTVTRTRRGRAPDASPSARPRLRATWRASVHGGDRRPRGQREDCAPARAVPAAAARPAARGRDERHLHPRGRRVPDPPRRAARGPHPRGRDRRLPACRDPRGREPQPARAARSSSTRSAPSCCSSSRAATTWPRSTAASSRTSRST